MTDDTRYEAIIADAATAIQEALRIQIHTLITKPPKPLANLSIHNDAEREVAFAIKKALDTAQGFSARSANDCEERMTILRASIDMLKAAADQLVTLSAKKSDEKDNARPHGASQTALLAREIAEKVYAYAEECGRGYWNEAGIAPIIEAGLRAALQDQQAQKVDLVNIGHSAAAPCWCDRLRAAGAPQDAQCPPCLQRAVLVLTTQLEEMRAENARLSALLAEQHPAL